jgi:hypothetical protein
MPSFSRKRSDPVTVAGLPGLAGPAEYAAIQGWQPAFDRHHEADQSWA